MAIRQRNSRRKNLILAIGIMIAIELFAGKMLVGESKSDLFSKKEKDIDLTTVTTKNNEVNSSIN